MADTFNMSDVFISYSRKDKVFVQRLAEAFKTAQKGVWVDWEDIPLATEWWEEIQAGIESAENFVFVISPDSVSSEVCDRELEHAIANRKRLIPLLFRDLVTPEEQKKLHPSLSSHNWVLIREADDFAKAFKSLVDTIETDIHHVRTHTRLLVRAREWDGKARDTSLLLRGSELTDAESWLSQAVGKKPEPLTLHSEYINASRQQEIRRQRTILTGVSVALVVAVGLAILSSLLWQQSQSNLSLAEQRGTQVADKAATATIAQGVAEFNAMTAVAAESTAVRSASESQSLFWASSAQVALENSNQLLALPLALTGIIDRPPVLAQRALADVAYSPGPRHLLTGHSDLVGAVAFSPDGRYLLSASDDETLILWDVATREPITYYEGHQAPVLAIDFSPDGRTFLSAFADSTLILWDTESGEAIRTFTGHRDIVEAVAFSPDGQTALSGSDDGTMILWDVASGEVLHTFAEHEDVVSSVAFSPDGTYAASGSQDRTLILYDLVTLEPLYDFVGHSGNVTDLTFSPDGLYLVSASQDGTMGVWDIENPDLTNFYVGHSNTVTSVTFSPDGTRLLSGSLDGTMVVWDFASGYRLFQMGRTDSIFGIDVSPDGQRAVSSAADGTLMLWDLSNGALVHSFTRDFEQATTAKFSPDGRYALTGFSDQTLLLWEAASSEIVQVYKGLSYWPLGIDFSPDGQTIVAGSCAEADDEGCLLGELVLWDTQSGEIKQQLTGHENVIMDVAYSPDGHFILSGAADGTMILWDAETGEPIRTMTDHEGAVNDVEFSPDGRYALSGGDDARVILWVVATGEGIRYLERHLEPVLSVAFAPDGKTAFSGSWDLRAIQWNISTGNPLRIFTGYTGGVVSLALNPDASLFVAGLSDGSLLVTDLASGDVLRGFSGHTALINDVDFSPDGRFILSSSGDGAVRLWHMDSSEDLVVWAQANRYTRELTCDEREIYNVEPYCPGATPMFTPIPREVAQVGDNRGEFPVGGGDVWTYNGRAGERLTIQVLAEHPADQQSEVLSEAELQSAGLLDVRFVVTAPDGSILIEGDDIDYPNNSDARVEGVELPMSGIYQIEIRGYDNLTGGGYTLTIESDAATVTPSATATP